MNDQADTQVETPNGTPTAGGQELTIPKWRLDEVSAQLRAAREELEIKNRLINEVSQRQQPHAAADEITPEQTGLDPMVHEAALRIARTIAKNETESLKKEFRSMVGALGNDVEATKFLMKHGNDKATYVEKIREFQKRHVATTGGYIDMESAFKMIRYDEMISRGSAPRVEQPAATPVQHMEPAYPNPALTRVQPASSGVAGAKTFAELSEDEMEARLNEALSAGEAI